MRIDVIFGYLISIACFLLGLVIVLSIFNDRLNYGINLIAATTTIVIAILFYNRTIAIKKILPYKCDTNNWNKKYLISNTIILSLELMVTLLFLTMAIYRTLGEKIAVFG